MRVFIMNGYMPYGGNYMIYQLGCILYERFGSQCFVVLKAEKRKAKKQNTAKNIFHYRHQFESITIEEMEDAVTEKDIILAPSSCSSLMMGLRLPGRKLMYIQAFTTYNVLDGFFDYYVCVSGFVKRFIETTYGIDAPVIPAYITGDMPKGKPWDQRPPGSILALNKSYSGLFLQRFKDTMRARHPQAEFSVTYPPPRITQDELLKLMSEHRYVLSLMTCEGFSLMPLEAMACGCTVIGFHGCGGTEFMLPGVNCEVTGYPDFDGLCDKAANVLSDGAYAQRLVAEGLATAKIYSHAAFVTHWSDYFEKHMGLKPTVSSSRLPS